jgi:hypothetical protein
MNAEQRFSIVLFPSTSDESFAIAEWRECLNGRGIEAKNPKFEFSDQHLSGTVGTRVTGLAINTSSDDGWWIES